MQPGEPPRRTVALQPGGPWSRPVPMLPGESAATRKGSSTGSLIPPAPGEFTGAVRLAVRKRAGNGSADDAMCEACGIWLGRHGGQVQHIAGRGMGGCRDEVINSAANAALLCGTPFDGCHGLATAFDEEMGARGFWLKRAADPRLVPMMLASEHGSGVMVWRAEDGKGPDGTGYLFEAPKELAA